MGTKKTITVHTANTPNGIKIPIALEELRLDYTLKRVDLDAGEQYSEAFTALNPIGRIPVLVDPNGPLGEEGLFESGAILWYLAEHYGGLLPQGPAAKLRALKWLTFQVAAVGPTFGQAGWFLRSAPQHVEFVVERFTSEARRQMGVLEQQLSRTRFLAGDTYSVADIAHFGWLRRKGYAGVSLDQFPALQLWLETIEGRPAVRRALARLDQ